MRTPRFYIRSSAVYYIHYRPKVWNIRKTQWKLSHQTFWFTTNGLAPTINKYGDFNVTPTCSVMDDKWNLQCPEKNIYRNLQKCVIFYISPKISHGVQAIQHYMVNVWKYCVYSIVRCWYDAKFAMGRHKHFGCKIKVAGRCDPRYSSLSFGAITKICFIFINRIYWTIRSGFHFILINMIYTIEADFRPDTKWKNTAPWGTPFCHFLLALRLLSGDRSQILRDTSN